MSLKNSNHYDTIVLGAGGVGSAALYSLAKRGIKALAIDRFAPPHNLGSSHGLSRMIRMAYFEHPDYVPLLRESYERWEQLERDTGEKLYEETGLLEVGIPDGFVVPGVIETAREHDLEIEEYSASELKKRFPQFNYESHWIGVYEKRAGFLRVERCVETLLRQAQELGCSLATEETILEVQEKSGRWWVKTDRSTYEADKLIVTLGAWSSQLFGDKLPPLYLLKQLLFWYPTTRTAYTIEQNCPGFFFEMDEAMFYGFPQEDTMGLKVAEHSGGEIVEDPLAIDRAVDQGQKTKVEGFLKEVVPHATQDLIDYQICFYTMTSDTHFIVDRMPFKNPAAVVTGLSGHGYKFAMVLGEMLVDLVTEGKTNRPVEFLRSSRLAPRL